MFVTVVLYQYFPYNVTILKGKESNFDVIRKNSLLGSRASQAALVVKNPLATAGDIRGIPSLGWEDPLEEAMATYSSIPASRIPWTEEPREGDGPQVIGLHRVGHNRSNVAHTHMTNQYPNSIVGNSKSQMRRDEFVKPKTS